MSSVFDRRQLRRAFGRAAPNYAAVAALQAAGGDDLSQFDLIVALSPTNMAQLSTAQIVALTATGRDGVLDAIGGAALPVAGVVLAHLHGHIAVTYPGDAVKSALNGTQEKWWSTMFFARYAF